MVETVETVRQLRDVLQAMEDEDEIDPSTPVTALACADAGEYGAERWFSNEVIVDIGSGQVKISGA